MKKFTCVWRLLILIYAITSMLDGKAHAQTWSAYNDCAGTTGGNTTRYTVTAGSTTGFLKDYSTGSNTSVTVTFSSSGSPAVQESPGSYTDPGTDAYTTFFNKASMEGIIQYGSPGYYLDMALTGLDTAKSYTFITTANRNSSSYTARITRFTLSGDEGATNASSAGVSVIDDHSVYFCTGFNTVNGYVAKWTGIKPGADGSFIVRVQEQTSGNSGYGPSVFMLQEETGPNPIITTTGTLNVFSSPVGTPSSEQSYIVAGINLTDAIVIHAPTDFEVSSTSGSGFSTSLSLAPDNGTVLATTVYVRLNPTTSTTYSANITHTSIGATEKIFWWPEPPFRN